MGSGRSLSTGQVVQRSTDAVKAACILVLGLTAVCPAQSSQPADRRTSPPLPFGIDAFDIPPNEKRIVASQRQIEMFGVALAAATGTDRPRLVAEVGRFGPAGLTFLRRYVSDSDPLVRCEIARAIASIRTPDAGELLNTLIGDSNASVRRESIIAASGLGRSDLILAGLSDTDPTVQRAALQYVSTADQARKVAELFNGLPSILKPAALRLLGRLDAKNHTALFKAQLRSDVAIRAAAVEALGMSEIKTDAAAVRDLLSDPAPTVRRSALKALRQVGSSAEQQAAGTAALNDSDATVRAAAAALLIDHPIPEAIPALRRQLEDEDETLHHAAREALAATNNAVLPTAESLLADGKPTLRADGSFLLGKIRSSTAIDRHLALLDDSDWSVVTQAAMSLSELQLQPEQVAPYITRVLQRSKPFGSPGEDEIRAVVQTILLAGKLGCTTVVSQFEPLVPVYSGRESAPDPMRCAALWAFGVLTKADSPAGKIVRGVTLNTSQSAAAVFESIKASINMGDSKVLPVVDGWRTERALNSDANTRWMAHRASDYFRNRQTPYEPLITDVPAESSVKPVQPTP